MCMHTVCLSVHVDQELHCFKAVLNDGSSLVLSCADVAAPQCSAHHSGCTPTSRTHTVLNTGIHRSHSGKCDQLDPVRHLVTKRKSDSHIYEFSPQPFAMNSLVIDSYTSLEFCLLQAIHH